MATKSSTKTKTAGAKEKTASKKTATKQDLLYIMSPQCGWCKKADPVVEELIKDGAKITTGKPSSIKARGPCFISPAG